MTSAWATRAAAPNAEVSRLRIVDLRMTGAEIAPATPLLCGAPYFNDQ
ncbi:hypothetical protein [Sphingomonas sp.]|nr:hypothetical protein [Sphingomonas sp.]